MKTTNKVTIVAHGYGQKIADGNRPWEAVVDDRMETVLRLAKWHRMNGSEPLIIVSGGTVHEGVNEANAVWEHSREKVPELKSFDIQLEREAKNTSENAAKVFPLAEGGLVVAISSRDHVPRLMREWAQAAKGTDVLVSVVASRECYSIRGEEGVQPFIAEPPFWGIDILPGFFKVQADKRAQVVSDVSRILAGETMPQKPANVSEHQEAEEWR